MSVLPAKVKDLRGYPPFGSLTVKRYVGQDKGKTRYALWECQCVCGNTVVVRSGSLCSGNTTSCGCAKKYTLEEAKAAFWAKVDKTGPIHPTLGSCWIWTGAKTDYGYGHLLWQGQWRMSHHVAYELLVGNVPEGLVTDHLCRNPSCINPAHLDPVTQRVNVIDRGTGPFAHRARQTHCKYGHEFTVANTYIHKSRGVRVCRTCHCRQVMEAKKKKQDKK